MPKFENLPPDPLSELAAGAIALHELYRSYVSAGFTADQAMQIICTLLTAGTAARGAHGANS